MIATKTKFKEGDLVYAPYQQWSRGDIVTGRS